VFAAVWGIGFIAMGLFNARRGGRIPLMNVIIGIAALLIALLRLSRLVSVLLVLAVTILVILVVIGCVIAARRAFAAGDRRAVERGSRLCLLLSGDTRWTSFDDIATWQDAARSAHAAARPILERVAHTPSPSQPYYELLLEAAYGSLDVPALVDQRWSETHPKLRPLLLHLAITELVSRGATNQALARLGQAKPLHVTKQVRLLIVAELAAATGDEQTLERLFGFGHPLIDQERVVLYRSVAKQARGETQAGTLDLQSLGVPPAGRTAREVARRLAHPPPVFAEASLNEDARRGLEIYRDLVKAIVAKGVKARS